MQLMNTLPTPEQLALPPEMAKRVVELLIEPFETKEVAQSYWQDNTTYLVILTTTDSDKILKPLSDLTQTLIIAATDNPEFVEILPVSVQVPDTYQLSLIVYSDAGHGLYLFKPVDMPLKFHQSGT